MSNKSLAVVLGEFVASASAGSIPQAVREEGRIRLLDALGCAIAGAGNITSGLAGKWAGRMHGAGPSTYWFGGQRGTMQDCALANSIFVHSILHEDASGSGHPACNVIPSALAVAEAERATGDEALAAIVLGYELQARIALRGAAITHVRAGALRPTAMSGIFGAVGAAARLLKLSKSQAKNAIAFCASLCSPGIGEPLIVGSFERCLQMGQLTRSGVLAAELALAGFDGADSALDGECGFYAAYLGMDAPVEAITQGLGVKWLSMSTDGAYIYKPYPTAALNLGATYCCEQIFKSKDFDHKDVASVLVRQSWWDRNTGYIFKGPFRTVEQALMSSPFAVATTLIHGRFDWPTAESAVGDVDVDTLASKVTVQGVIGDGRRRYESASVDITLYDGRERRMAIDALPSEMVALNWDGVVRKFQHMTGGNLSDLGCTTIVELVRDIDSLADVTGLTNALGEVTVRKGWR